MTPGAAIRIAIRALQAQRQPIAFEANLFKMSHDPVLASQARAYDEYTTAIAALQLLLHK